MRLRALDLQNLIAFFSYLPIEIAEIKPLRNTVAPKLQLSTCKFKYQ